MKRTIAVFGLAALFSGASAFAGQVVQTLNIPTQTLDFVTSLNFNQFDPSLGTLNDIQFVTDGTTNDSVTVTNQSGRPRIFTISTSVDILIENLSKAVFFDEVIPTGTQTLTLVAGETQTVNGSATGSATAVYSAPSGVLTSYTGSAAIGTPSSPINIAGFIGFGTLNLIFDASNNSYVSGGSNSSVTSGTAGGSLDVIYDYSTNNVTTATPEPGSMLLFGSALIGVGTLRRLRKPSL